MSSSSSSMLTRLKPLLRAALLGVVLLAAPAAAQAQTPPAQSAPAQAAPARPPAAQDEFVPVSELPESEKLPAAPFLIAAYTIVWLVLLVYVWSLWRRLTQVEQELKQAVQAASVQSGSK